jgi:hypothetical protein
MSTNPSHSTRVIVLACSALALSALLPVKAGAQLDDYPPDGHYCTGTANALFEACRSQGEPDYWKTVAVCTNIEDDDERRECFDEASAERREGADTCRAQLNARRDVCSLLDEDRHDPDFEPHLFDHDFTRLTRPNAYYPLNIGNRWEYAAPDETITVEILNKTKLIEGVTCIVVNDKVRVAGQIVEDTNDWIAQARDGDVYYCGEEVKDFETFAGDAPTEPEMTSIDGSFKAGRDGDKPGILFRSVPTEGETYRQEFSAGNAEDVADVLSTTYAYGRDAKLDRFVPRALADLFCPGDCVVTREYTALEPGVFELKYYARRIGKFLEVTPGSGKVVRLIGCNVDSRCNVLSR